jgi:hypothetical protein
MIEPESLYAPFSKAITGLLWTSDARPVAEALCHVSGLTTEESAALEQRFGQRWAALKVLITPSEQDADSENGSMYRRVLRFDEEERRSVTQLLWEIYCGIAEAVHRDQLPW